MKKIAFLAQKGGSGKTTLAVHTAVAATEAGESVVVIDTDPLITTKEGGHWWDVAVPEVSPRSEVNTAREAYVKARSAQSLG